MFGSDNRECMFSNVYVYVDSVIPETGSSVFELWNSTMVHVLHSPGVLAQLLYLCLPLNEQLNSCLFFLILFFFIGKPASLIYTL